MVSPKDLVTPYPPCSSEEVELGIRAGRPFGGSGSTCALKGSACSKAVLLSGRSDLRGLFGTYMGLKRASRSLSWGPCLCYRAACMLSATRTGESIVWCTPSGAHLALHILSMISNSTSIMENVLSRRHMGQPTHGHGMKSGRGLQLCLRGSGFRAAASACLEH